MQHSQKNIHHHPLAAPRPTFGFGSKVQCPLATPLESKPDVLKVVPDRPFATTYPTFNYPEGSKVMPRHHH